MEIPVRCEKMVRQNKTIMTAGDHIQNKIFLGETRPQADVPILVKLHPKNFGTLC